MFHKHELISSHTARRSFATNNYLDGVPIPTIRAITGHKTDQAFYKYIKVDGQKHAELLNERWAKEYMKEAK